MQAHAARQPLLNDAVVLVSAPSQAWSDDSGDMGALPIHGFYHSDVRILGTLALTVDDTAPEWIARSDRGSARSTFVGLARALDDETADPRVRIERERAVADGSLSERITIVNRRAVPIRTRVHVAATVDFADIQTIKAGATARPGDLAGRATDDGAEFSAGAVTAVLSSPGAETSLVGDTLTSTWRLAVPAGGRVEVVWEVRASDEAAVVAGAGSTTPWAGFLSRTDDSRLSGWLTRALADLDGLRMVTRATPEDQFLAAGAPWFFTLFGRDSIWAARMLLPLGTELAASTLRVLAAHQGSRVDPETAEQPGKIMHELRRGELSLPGEGVSLPPLYFGTVDATPLWIMLLHDAWNWGMPEDEVRALIPHLEAALAWMRDFGDSDGDGFLEYIDLSGHGLANQGWKDSGDSIQWRDGRLAEGPIALCEVQGYAYEAAIAGARLLDRFGRPGADEWRGWAQAMKQRFAEQFWIDDPEGPYPAVALDARKRRVDTVTSNIGHLLGTGILDAAGARRVASRLAGAALSSGYGLRTLSADSAGFWPLSYHGGSVWTHDTAIAIAGLVRCGFPREAEILIEGLLKAAEGFGYQVPELHSGDGAVEWRSPVPYPAACRPQAWSAAAAVAVLAASLGLSPDAQGENSAGAENSEGAEISGAARSGPRGAGAPPARRLTVRPLAGRGAIDVSGLRFRGQSFSVATDATGAVVRNTLPSD
jgi:glycogen debranching enzyme